MFTNGNKLLWSYLQDANLVERPVVHEQLFDSELLL